MNYATWFFRTCFILGSLIYTACSGGENSEAENKKMMGVEANVQKAQEDKNAWEAAQSSNSIQGLEAYLASFPEGKYKSQAEAKIAELEKNRQEEDAWESAVKANKLDAYESFIGNFPDGKYADAAFKQIEILKREADEEAAWQSAKTQNSVATLETYLRDYPAGKYAALAKDKLAAAKEQVEKEKAESRKKLGLMAFYDIADKAQAGKDHSGNNLHARVHLPDCLALSPGRKPGTQSVEFNFPGGSCHPDNEPCALVGPHISFSETFSFTAWIYLVPDSYTGKGWIMGQSGKNQFEDEWAQLFIGEGTPASDIKGRGEKVSFLIPHSGTPLILTDPQKVVKNKWMHFVVTVERMGNSTLAILYRDGVEAARVTKNAVYRNPGGSTSFLIGNGAPPPDDVIHFRGRLDDIRVYNRALTAADIKLLFAD